MIIEKNKPGSGIVLTFDDGPNPEHTPGLLSVLEQLQVTAYFFIVGRALKEQPALGRAIHDAGHILCNHSFTHPHLTQLSVDEQRAELEQCSAAIAEITGSAPKWFRPPYFDSDDALQGLVAEMHMHCVNCSIRSKDTTKDIDSQGVESNLRDTKHKMALFYVMNGASHREKPCCALYLNGARRWASLRCQINRL